jgi:hypothetical protein
MVHASHCDQADGDTCGVLKDSDSVVRKVLKVRCEVRQQPITG